MAAFEVGSGLLRRRRSHRDGNRGVAHECTVNLPPLTPEQARDVRHHFQRNTRTLTFPRWLPGNWFTANVPWQIEHHLFPTAAGAKLALISPWVQAHARERGVPLHYEAYFHSAIDVARTRFAWGADGQLHRFADIDRLLATGTAPQHVPGYLAETRAVPRRDLRDVLKDSQRLSPASGNR